MQDLVPLTIYNSLYNKPTVLLTTDLKKYTFIQPYSKSFLLTLQLYRIICQHFKIELLEVGAFKYDDVKYFCSAAPDGLVELSNWLEFLWSSKRKRNHFVFPEILFKMGLIELYFPLFLGMKKWILPGRKDRFILDTAPLMYPDNRIHFTPKSIHKLEFDQPAFKQLLFPIRDKLKHIAEEFEVLHHEKLHQQLKYQTSLFPAIRNQYWDEIKKCYTDTRRDQVRDAIHKTLLKLG